MAEKTDKEILAQAALKSPWLIAVWPGMGHVGINAAFYLASKMEMRLFAEL
jgi:uncharacterized protein